MRSVKVTDTPWSRCCVPRITRSLALVKETLGNHEKEENPVSTPRASKLPRHRARQSYLRTCVHCSKSPPRGEISWRQHCFTPPSAVKIDAHCCSSMWTRNN